MVVLHKNLVLMVRQAPGTSLAGQWSVPWGVVEAGETADVAAVTAVYVSMDELAGLEGEVEPWSDWLIRRVLAGVYSLIEQNDGAPFPGAAFL